MFRAGTKPFHVKNLVIPSTFPKLINQLSTKWIVVAMKIYIPTNSHEYYMRDHQDTLSLVSFVCLIEDW